MGWVLISGDRWAINISGDPAYAGIILPYAGTVLEKAFDAVEHFTGCSRRVYVSAKLAAVPNAMRKPASELLHFSHSIRLVGSINFLIVARK